MTSLRERAVNLVLYQAGWLGCVVGAGHGQPLAGATAALAVVMVHLSLATRPLRSALTVMAAAVVGVVFESALVLAGWVVYPGRSLAIGLAPLWMVTLWAAFATTLDNSLAWMQQRHSVAALFGAVGGPLSYWAGERLGALRLEQPLPALLAIAAGWAIATPLLLELARRVQGTRRGAA